VHSVSFLFLSAAVLCVIHGCESQFEVCGSYVGSTDVQNCCVDAFFVGSHHRPLNTEWSVLVSLCSLTNTSLVLRRLAVQVGKAFSYV
jgi:hypothetical protein